MQRGVDEVAIGFRFQQAERSIHMIDVPVTKLQIHIAVQMYSTVDSTGKGRVIAGVQCAVTEVLNICLTK